MQITENLKASDGTGNAILAHVTIARLVGSTVLKVDSVSKWSATSFIATVGTLDGTGFMTPASITEFVGHITAGDIIIDSFEPGFTDLGNAVNQVVVVKQTVGWANRVKTAVDELQTEDITRQARTMADFIQSGGIWSLVSGFNGAMTALVAYQAGIPITSALIASRAYTASKDTYVDVLRGGTNITPTATIVYTEVANNAASPALAANSIRLAKIVTSGVAITSITQNGVDSLGNKIYNVAPNIARDLPILGRQGGSATDFQSSGTTNYDPRGLGVFIQAGSLSVGGGSTVTFPVPFSQKPLIFASVNSANSQNVFVRITSAVATGMTLTCITDGGALATGELVNWLAIGV